MTALTRQALHPDVRATLNKLEQVGAHEFHHMSAPEARTLMSSIRPDPSQYPLIHQSNEVIVDVDGGSIALRIYRPSSEHNLPALIWIHGGGWVFGDLDSAELPCRHLANETRCVVISVDYRLAPEFAFPVPLNDCISAMHWVIDNANPLSIDINRIAIGGDSAGGNLATCVAQVARDEGIRLAYQLLVYPVTQPSIDTPSYVKNDSGYFLSRASMQWFWDHYAPSDDQRHNPQISPLFGNLEDLAPAWIFTCSYDPLCDDGLMYAQALQAADVEVSTYHREDTIHAVFGMAIDPAVEIRDVAAAQLRKAFGTPD